MTGEPAGREEDPGDVGLSDGDTSTTEVLMPHANAPADPDRSAAPDPLHRRRRVAVATGRGPVRCIGHHSATVGRAVLGLRQGRHVRPLEPAPGLPEAVGPATLAADPGAAGLAELGTGADRVPATAEPFHRPQGPDPLRRSTAVVLVTDQPGHRSPVAGQAEGPMLRARSAGDLIHVDVKRLGRIPDGGNRVHGRATRTSLPAGSRSSGS